MTTTANDGARWVVTFNTDRGPQESEPIAAVDCSEASRKWCAEVPGRVFAMVRGVRRVSEGGAK